MSRTSRLVFVLSLLLLVHADWGWGEEPLVWRARQPSGAPVRVSVEPPEEDRFSHLSWNKVVRTPRGTLVLAYVAGAFAVENPARPGEILVLTTERQVPGNRPGSIQLWRGSAQQLDWQRDRILLEFPHLPDDPHRDFGYPWLTPLKNNRWLMFYYHGKSRGYCPLWVTEVDLSTGEDS